MSPQKPPRRPIRPTLPPPPPPPPDESFLEDIVSDLPPRKAIKKKIPVERVAEDVVANQPTVVFDDSTDDDEDELDLYQPEDDELEDEDYVEDGDESAEESLEDEDGDNDNKPDRKRKKERRKKEEEKEPKKEKGKEEPGKKEEPKGSKSEGPAGKREPNPLKSAEKNPKLTPQEATKLGRAGETAGQVGQAGGRVVGTAEEAGQIAGGTAQAAGGAVKVAGGATRVVGGAAEAVGGVAEAGEAGAALVATSEFWLPIIIITLLVILTVIVCITIIGIARWAWRAFNLGNMFGTTVSMGYQTSKFMSSVGRYGIADPRTALEAIKTGAMIKDEVAGYVRDRLNSASKEAAKINPDSAEGTKLQSNIQAAESALTYLSQSTGNDRVEYYNQAQQLFYHLDRIDATLLGVGAESPSQLVDRASSANSLTWVRTTNDNDPSQPLRDGSNVVNNKRGCDAAGFVTYVLRDPAIPCAECTSPNIEDIPETFQSALETVPIEEDFSPDKLVAGDVVLTKKNGATDNGDFQTLYGGFIFLGSDRGFAYCGQNAIGNLPTNQINTDRVVTNVLRLKTPPR